MNPEIFFFNFCCSAVKKPEVSHIEGSSCDQYCNHVVSYVSGFRMTFPSKFSGRKAHLLLLAYYSRCAQRIVSRPAFLVTIPRRMFEWV